MIELRINCHDGRKDVVNALIEAGYTVRVITKEIQDRCLTEDYFVQILEGPRLPKYKEKEEVQWIYELKGVAK